MEYLTTKEYKLLRENLGFYVSLDCGKKTPTSNSQKQFVSVCKGLEEAKTEHEIAYIKYKKAGLIRSDLRSEEIIFKKISAKNKKYVIAPELPIVPILFLHFFLTVNRATKQEQKSECK